LLLAFGAGAAFGARDSASPSALYRALLTTPINASQLPSGFFSASPGIGEPSSNSKSHHIVGEVDVDVDSGDAAIIYEVFPSRASAVADWNASKPSFKKVAKSTMAAPSTFPWPAIILNGSITGKNAFGKTVTNGITTLAFTSHNVIVEAATISTSNTQSGDIPGAIQLGHFALKHLNALRK
jgi:hypothetical protein